MLAHSDDHKWLIKIGKTVNLKNRISNIQSGCPYMLRPYAAFQTENPSTDEVIVLNHLSKFRMRGEWFNLPDSKIDWISDYFSKMQLKYRGIK